MSTVMQTIARLLPRGTSRGPDTPVRVSWSVAPSWAPDLFAVAATLVNLSGCYAHAKVTGGPDPDGDDGAFAERTQRLGRSWRELRYDRDLWQTVGHHWKQLLL